MVGGLWQVAVSRKTHLLGGRDQDEMSRAAGRKGEKILRTVDII
jgi:hypothetical protein